MNWAAIWKKRESWLDIKVSIRFDMMTLHSYCSASPSIWIFWFFSLLVTRIHPSYFTSSYYIILYYIILLIQFKCRRMNVHIINYCTVERKWSATFSSKRFLVSSQFEFNFWSVYVASQYFLVVLVVTLVSDNWIHRPLMSSWWFWWNELRINIHFPTKRRETVLGADIN